MEARKNIKIKRKKSRSFPGKCLRVFLALISFFSIIVVTVVVPKIISTDPFTGVWIKNDGKCRYYGKDGELYTGWHYMTSEEGEDVEHWSYFDEDGYMSVGRNIIDGEEYVFSKDLDGKTHEGWLLYDKSNDKFYNYTWETGGLSYTKAVAHRGYNDGVPENNLIAYREAGKRGFKYVETDLAVTKDGVVVLSHDPTINRCARDKNGAQLKEDVYVKDVDYKELLKYDFGICESTKYKGTKISKFEDFLKLCKELKLHPYIELKRDNIPNKDKINEIVDLVKKYDMQNNVTWISFYPELLDRVVMLEARKGYLVGAPLDDEKIKKVKKMRDQGYDAFLSVGKNYNPSDEEIANCIKYNIPVQCWTINTLDDMKNMNPYISGISSDSINVEKIYDN